MPYKSTLHKIGFSLQAFKLSKYTGYITSQRLGDYRSTPQKVGSTPKAANLEIGTLKHVSLGSVSVVDNK